jgi:hypothetical protein
MGLSRDHSVGVGSAPASGLRRAEVALAAQARAVAGAPPVIGEGNNQLRRGPPRSDRFARSECARARNPTGVSEGIIP